MMKTKNALQSSLAKNAVSSISYVFLSLLILCNYSTIAHASSSMEVTFETLESGSNSGNVDYRHEVFHSSSDFQTFWNQHASINHPPSPPPEIDFETSMIAVVSREDKPSGGYSIHVKSVTENDATLTVHCELSDPPPGSIVTQAITQPFEIIKMEASRKTVRFTFDTLIPEQPFPTFILKFEGTVEDTQDVVEAIESYDSVKNTQTLRSIKMIFVNFDANKIGGDRVAAKELLERVVADRDGVEYLEADPSEETWPRTVRPETRGERPVTKLPFPMYVLKYDGAVEDYRGIVEAIESFDPVDHTQTLTTSKMIFVFFDGNKIGGDRVAAKQFLERVVEDKDGIKYLNADPKEEDWPGAGIDVGMEL